MKQKPFSFRDLQADAEYLSFDERFRTSNVLEYTLLLGHVLIEEHLRGLICARLGSDSLPDVKGFALVAGLALAGSEYATDLEDLTCLNEARNQVGHKLHRTDFDHRLRTFIASLTGQGKTADQIDWPVDEGKRARMLRIAMRCFIVWIAARTEYYLECHALGAAAFQAKQRDASATDDTL